MIKCRKLCTDEHEERLRRQKCPNCLSRLEKVKIDEIQSFQISKKYKIVDYIWACSGEKKHNCFFISSGENMDFFESSAAPMINFNEEYEKPVSYGKIIRRRNGQSLEINPIISSFSNFSDIF